MISLELAVSFMRRRAALSLCISACSLTCRFASVEISRSELILLSSASLSATDCISPATSTSLAAPACHGRGYGLRVRSRGSGKG